MKNLYFIFKKLTLSKLSKIIFEKDHDLYFAYQSYAILFLAIPFYSILLLFSKIIKIF